MIRSEFDYIWRYFIRPAAIEILSYYPPDEGEKWSWQFDDSNLVRDGVFAAYTEYNASLHNDYFQGDRIDMHKIASCLCAALIDVAPMSCCYTRNTPWVVGVSNYLLAFHSSMALVYTNLLDEFEEENALFAERLKKRRRFAFPRVTIGHDLYAIGKVKSLALNHHYEKPFDILGYADTLFWLEIYNRHVVKTSI